MMCTLPDSHCHHPSHTHTHHPQPLLQAGLGGGGSVLDVKRIVSTDKHIVKVSSYLQVPAWLPLFMSCAGAVARRLASAAVWFVLCVAHHKPHITPLTQHLPYLTT